MRSRRKLGNKGQAMIEHALILTLVAVADVFALTWLPAAAAVAMTAATMTGISCPVTMTMAVKTLGHRSRTIKRGGFGI